MPDQPQMSLNQLLQLYQQQQQQMMQPQGRYFGQTYVPNMLDKMVSPFGGMRPPDRNTFDPNDVSTFRNNPMRQEDL